jgi:hypothetical protein
LSLGALYRVLPTCGRPHAREKRLHRFLKNWRLDPRAVNEGLARLVCGRRGRGLWPIVFDQTKAGATQALVAGVPFEGRCLPLAVYCFDYPWQERAALSQNQLEEIFLADVETSVPEGTRGVFIGDRGYSRAALIRHCCRLGRLFIIRGRSDTQVEFQGRTCKLAELPVKSRRAVRYRNVRYQAKEKVPVDIVAFQDPAFREPWWLLVPAGTKSLLSSKAVVALYRQRMQIEHTFRDFKTHLGLRGLKLKVRVAERTGRLLLAFTIAYCLALALGVTSQAQAAREHLEVPRRHPRHGTRRTLSALSVAMQILSHPRWRNLAHHCLRALIRRITQGRPCLRRAPPAVVSLTKAA